MRAGVPEGGILVVCVDDKPGALLPKSARAEMAAALAAVDYVLTEPLPSSLIPDAVIDLRADDASWAAALRRRVHERQAAAEKPTAE